MAKVKEIYHIRECDEHSSRVSLCGSNSKNYVSGNSIRVLLLIEKGFNGFARYCVKCRSKAIAELTKKNGGKQ